MAEDKQREKNQTLFEDLCLRARRGSRVYSKFLSPDAAARLKNLAARQGLICLPLGGGQDAERVLCAVYQEEWQQPADDETPLCVLAIRFDERFGEIGHRDVLGAILGLGIERECVGDIRIEPGCAYAAVYAPMASYICNNLDKAGRTSVKAEIASCPLPPPPRGKMQRVNVPSLRLGAARPCAGADPRRPGSAQLGGGTASRRAAANGRHGVRARNGPLPRAGDRRRKPKKPTVY